MTTTGTITGHIQNFISTVTTPASAVVVSFKPSIKKTVNSSTQDITVLTTVWAPTDNNGDFSVVLPATDDPDEVPINWTYLVTIHAPLLKNDSFSIQVPGGVSTDLSEIIPVAESNGVLTLQGPEGPEGPPGPEGPEGPAGADGADGATDHGALTGLGDDDHTQYHTDARGDARYYTQIQVDTSLSGKAATGHSHTLSDVTDSGSAAALNVPETGDAAAGEVVKGDDTRLTNSRTPTTHSHTLSDVTDSGSAAALNVPETGDAAAGEVVKGDDTRLTNSRTPTTHSHVIDDVTNLTPSILDYVILPASAGVWSTPPSLPDPPSPYVYYFFDSREDATVPTPKAAFPTIQNYHSWLPHHTVDPNA